MSKHTPGPWVVEGLNVYGNVEGGPVARIAPVGPGNPFDEANARLVGAAPDLLEALAQTICITCEEPVGGPPIELPGGIQCPSCRAARSAIAKARGDDPANCPGCGEPNNNAEPGRCAECVAEGTGE